MNESKCPHCGEDMVWVGDMLTGGLQCVDDLCLGAENSGMLVEDLGPDEADARIKADSPRLAHPYAYLDQSVEDRPDIVKLVAENVLKNNKLLERLNPDGGWGRAPTVDDHLDPQPTYIAPSRLTGKTAAMVLRAMDADEAGHSVVILCHSKVHAKYITDMVKAGYKHWPRIRVEVLGPDNSNFLRGLRRETSCFIDHHLEEIYGHTPWFQNFLEYHNVYF